MVESQTLKLVFGATAVTEIITLHLVKALEKKGYESVTTSSLSFLSTLECGVNYASEIARSIGVSRQMVAKTVKALCQDGYLEQIESSGKQKEILFTELGEKLMSDSRKLLAQLDKGINNTIGTNRTKEAIASLEQIQILVRKLNTELL